MKNIFILTIMLLLILMITLIVGEVIESQFLLSQSKLIHSLIAQQLFWGAAAFLFGGFMGASITILWVKRLSKSANTQIHVPQSTQPRLLSPYVTRLDANAPALVVEDPEEESVIYESFSGWGW